VVYPPLDCLIWIVAGYYVFHPDFASQVSSSRKFLLNAKPFYSRLTVGSCPVSAALYANEDARALNHRRGVITPVESLLTFEHLGLSLVAVSMNRVT
jgi:hypothetical protein